jgi:ketosteroid isomerase-like protein
MTATPFLERWFAIMDSDDPDRVLDLITDDFVMSIQFSKGEGESAEFLGDRAGLEAYLEQREKSVLVHHLTHGARVEDVELVLGRTTRDGAFEASFNASAMLDPTTDRCRRLLIGRTPKLEFPES